MSPSAFDPTVWERFTPYGAGHGATVAICIALLFGLARVGRALSPAAEHRLRRALAATALAFWLVYNIWWNWNGVDFYDGLPLHVCDLAGLLAPAALIARRRWMRATLYFWAFAFTAQAFIQPTVTAGPAQPAFWMFWISHLLIVACAVYDLAVLGFRPGWSDFGRACAVSLAYGVLIAPVNALLGSNYGYVGNPPPTRPIPPFVEWLGPWPFRIVFIVGIAVAGFVVLLLPWLARRSAREHEQMRPDEAPGELRP